MSEDLEWRYEDLRNDLLELQRATNIEAAELRQENAALRRQLAEVATRVNAADRAVADARRERDAAKSTAADLRRQLAACQAELYGMRAQLGDVRVLRMQLESDNVALRRQLAEALGKLDKPPPTPTCGHRGMAGSVGCILLVGHAGPHEYRTFSDDHSDDVALRRQLAECQATMAEWREIAIARGEALGYAEADWSDQADA